ncbi:MAG: ABC transporter permease [Tepidisphaeraceae bacterium]
MSTQPKHLVVSERAAPATSATPPARAKRFRLTGWTRLVWPLTALALILLFNYFFTPNFFALQLRGGRLTGYLTDVLHNGSQVMLLALGMTLVIATGGIDLSVGAVMAISGAVAACLMARPDYSPLAAIDVGGQLWAVIAIALLAALIAGLWNGTLVALVGVQPIVATLILMVAGRGIAQLFTAGQNVDIRNRSFDLITAGNVLWLPFTVTLVAITALVAGALTRRTGLGLFIEAVGNNPTASRYAGINERLVKLAVYAFCGLCAGLAGLIEAANIRTAASNVAGLYKELDAILAVSIGGTALTGGRFSLIGSLIGALVIQSLTTTILAHEVPRAVDLMIKAGVVILVCLLQSEAFRAVVRRVFRRATGDAP